MRRERVMFITGDYNRRSYNCYSGNVCYLLERKGFLLSEHMSFGLCAGLGFQFELSDSVKFRAVRELHCLTEYLNGLGLKIKEKQLNGGDDFAIKLKKAFRTICHSCFNMMDSTSRLLKYIRRYMKDELLW